MLWVCVSNTVLPPRRTESRPLRGRLHVYTMPPPPVRSNRKAGDRSSRRGVFVSRHTIVFRETANILYRTANAIMLLLYIIYPCRYDRDKGPRRSSSSRIFHRFKHVYKSRGKRTRFRVGKHKYTLHNRNVPLYNLYRKRTRASK